MNPRSGGPSRWVSAASTLGENLSGLLPRVCSMVAPAPSSRLAIVRAASNPTVPASDSRKSSPIKCIRCVDRSVDGGTAMPSPVYSALIMSSPPAARSGEGSLRAFSGTAVAGADGARTGIASAFATGAGFAGGAAAGALGFSGGGTGARIGGAACCAAPAARGWSTELFRRSSNTPPRARRFSPPPKIASGSSLPRCGVGAGGGCGAPRACASLRVRSTRIRYGPMRISAPISSGDSASAGNCRPLRWMSRFVPMGRMKCRPPWFVINACLREIARFGSGSTSVQPTPRPRSPTDSPKRAASGTPSASALAGVPSFDTIRIQIMRTAGNQACAAYTTAYPPPATADATGKAVPPERLVTRLSDSCIDTRKCGSQDSLTGGGITPDGACAHAWRGGCVAVFRSMVLAAMLAAASWSVCAADVPGTITILEGEAQIFRGVSRYVAAEGVRLAFGDIVETGENTFIQIELSDQSALQLGGISRVMINGGTGKPKPERWLYLMNGWVKFSGAKRDPKADAYELRAPLFEIAPNPGTVVLLSTPTEVQLFVERGEVRLAER